MVDLATLDTFSARLDYVLEQLGMSNKDFADEVDADGGQQKVYNWRQRGRIGGPSLSKVNAILKGRVDMLWLNEGVGQPFVGLPPSMQKLRGLTDDDALEFINHDKKLRVESTAPPAYGASQPAPDKASHWEQLDDDRLDRAVRFLERQFALFDREFTASEHIRLISGVYARIGKPNETNLVQLSQWLLEQLGGEDLPDVRKQKRGT